MTPKLKLKTCKACKTKFMPHRALQSVCSQLCAITYTNISKEKNNRAIALKMRRETKEKLENIKTRQEYLKEAQRFFNIFIRTRDAKLPCISCGRHHTGQYHAGHYRTVGAAPQLRFDEANCHKQCAPCNNHLSGNIVAYRAALEIKIGKDGLARIESAQEPKHYTIDEIKAIKVKYKQKTKELLNQGE